MKKKTKLQKTDGLGPLEIKKIRQAVRQVWHRCHARKLVVERCTGFDGYLFCETCDAKTPKIHIDHINKVGDVDAGFILRMFVPSNKLQGMCKKCHDAKTKKERAEARLKKPHS